MYNMYNYLYIMCLSIEICCKVFFIVQCFYDISVDV